MKYWIFALLIAASSQVQAGETAMGPVAIFSCPTKGVAMQSVDLSTGIAPWVVEGVGVPGGKARATPISMTTLPLGWKARLPGAIWVQAMPAAESQAHASGEYVFSLSFLVKKGALMPRLSLTGQIIGDEYTDLTLVEPSPQGQGIASGNGAGDETPGDVEQGDLIDIALTKSADASGKLLGHRSGMYRLQISVANGVGTGPAVGLLAKLQLKATCPGRGRRK